MMFGSFRRHQKWIWILGVLVIIPSFVIFFSPTASLGGGRGGSRAYTVNGKPATINGRPIGLDEFHDAYTETTLGHLFHNGTWPDADEKSKENLEREAAFRVFMLYKVKELGIEVSDEAVARLTIEWLGMDRLERSAIPNALANFEKDRLQPHGVSPVEFARFMHHETAIKQLFGVVTTSARLIKPQEAEILYRRDHEEVATELAVFWASNYVDKVTVTPAAVAAYYTNNMPRYRVPERVQVNYVEFPATNYMAEAEKKLAGITNYATQVNETLARRDTNSALFKDASGKPLDEAAAKAKIQEMFQHHEALLSARRQASEFGNELINLPQPDRADNLERLAAAKNFVVKLSAPFERLGELDNTNFPPEFREKAFKLTKENPNLFAPIQGEEAVYLISLKSIIPSEMPPFEKVQEKVTTDYKNAQALDLARAAGNSFAASVTNGLAQKKSFTEICEQAKVKPLVVPPFSFSMSSLTNLDERISFYMVKNMAFSLKPGEATPFYPLPRQEGGMLLYFRAKLPLPEAKLQAELPEYTARLRLYRQNEDFNQWLTRQAELARLSVPRRETSLSPGS